MDENRAFAFGRFVLAPKRRELRSEGGTVGVGSRALDILITLVTRHPAIVSKDELISSVWPNRRVEENNLTVHMAALRRALGDRRDGTRFVQTLHGRGYCFVAPITVIDADPARQIPLRAITPAIIRGKGLPQPASPFIGRAAELDEIARMVTVCRLVTITGIGGIGKTRIALQLGKTLSLLYTDGVHFVELATIGHDDAVIEAIAATFYLGGGEASSLERLVGFIGDRQMLLILDNCEHLVEPLAALTRALLAECPRLTILTTSRERLSIDGEGVYGLRPFAVPRTEAIDAESALDFDAVRLFVARAAATTDGFTFDDRVAPEIARIFARLDGIALAIEMAAPRLQVLSPAQLADRLSERFRLLASQKRDAVPRHRTLRAVFDWSYELLSEPERVLLQRLAVFAGGADFEAVAALAAEKLSDEWDLLDLLEALINKSLVIADRSGREPRYRMLETTRQYAVGKWTASEAQRLRGLHASHFAHVFERSEAEWPTTPTSTWLEAYAPDADNLRAALDWALGADGDSALALRLVAHSYPLWWDLPQLPLHESCYWFDRAVSRITPSTPPEIAARLWFGKSWRDVRFGDRENFPAAARAAMLFRQVGDPIGLVQHCGALAARCCRSRLSTRPPVTSPRPSSSCAARRPTNGWR